MTDVPKHLAIIMDGNRRWARQRGISPERAHESAAPAMISTIRGAVRNGIAHVTFFCLSDANLLRAEAEVRALRRLRSWLWTKEVTEFLEEIDAKVLVVGEGLESFDREEIIDVTTYQPDVPSITVAFAVNYNARKELERVATDIGSGRYSSIEEYYDKLGIPDVDLLVRTSGEKRLSGFLLWQAAFAEIHFTDTLWPDFDEHELQHAIREYKKRDRRFGR